MPSDQLSWSQIIDLLNVTFTRSRWPPKSGRPRVETTIALALGLPGVGKSSLVQQQARQQNLELIDLRVTLLDPVDLRGLPRLNKPKVNWCSPSLFPTKGSGILFLDELAQATRWIRQRAS
jgi:hypothetical protein